MRQFMFLLNPRKIALFASVALLVMLPFCKAQSEQIILNEDEVLVEMIDYKRSIIIGYMVLKNGNIIKKVRFSQPKSIIMQATQTNPNLNMPQAQQSQQETQITQNPQNLQATQSTQDNTTQSEYEKQISQKPKKEKRSWFSSRKNKKPKHITQNMIDSQSIPQESGTESSELNYVYKNRQWDKKKIPHNIQSQVINLQD